MLLGDSILKGIVLEEEDNRYAVHDGIQLGKLSTQFGLNFFNRSKFGSTISKAYQTAERLLKSGNASYDYAVLAKRYHDCIEKGLNP